MKVTQVEKLTDDEVVQKVLDGESALYELIVRRYNDVLYKVGRSYNYSHDDTQDLMQDTYIDAYKNLSQFEGRASFKTWMVRIMLNNCYRKSHKLSFKNETVVDINENVKPMFQNADRDTERLINNRELKHIVEDALTKIPEDYRMVFSMREVNGFNVAETADMLHLSESNVKVRLNRAKTMLKDVIVQSYSQVELFDFNLKYCDAMVERVMKVVNSL